VGGIEVPSYGRITPLTASDAATVEFSKAALRCVRRSSPVAGLLQVAAAQSLEEEDEDAVEEGKWREEGQGWDAGGGCCCTLNAMTAALELSLLSQMPYSWHVFSRS
jgi:hypothetical protein